MPRRAYSYLRFSSKRQAKGDSRRRQLAFAEEIAGELDAVLDDSLTLEDLGVSAFRGRNKKAGALALFLEAVRSGRVSAGSILIVESLDRLSREDVDEAYEVVRSLLKAGITIVTREPRRVYEPAQRTDMLHILEWLFIAARAHEESAVKSMRAREAWKTRKRRAVAERRPIGRRCPDWLEFLDGQFVVRPTMAESIREMFRLACDGLGVHRVAKALKGQPERYRCPSKIGWTPDYVWRILRSRSVLGEFQPRAYGPGHERPTDGPPVPGYYPAVVTEEQWQLAQAALQQRRRTSGRPGQKEANLFTGILFHAETRRRLCVHTCTCKTGGRTYRYRWLHDYRLARAGRIRYELFEHGILRTIRTELHPPDVVPPRPQAEARECRIAALTGRLTALDLRQQQLVALAADPDEDLVTNRAARKAVADELVTTAKELEALKLDSLTGLGETLGELKSLIQHLDEAKKKGTAEEEPLRLRFKARLRSLVESIWVLPQVISRQKMILHVQIYLRGGRRWYVQILPRPPLPAITAVWDLCSADFRAGDIGGVAAHP